MFFGEYPYKLDEKGRVLVPPRFRQELKAGIVLTPGVEPCIMAYPLAEWKKLADSVTSGSFTRSKMRKLNRAMFATAFFETLDGQGRIALSPALREHAGIEEEVIVAGANTYLELWNREKWEQEKASSQEQAWQIIESLERQ